MSADLKLTATTPTEKRVLDYLVQNASPVLAEKINAGTKTIKGALKYARSEAQKMAAGEECICVEDATVFGWIVHYFEEEHIAEKPAAAPRLPGGKTAPAAPAAPAKAAAKPEAKPAPKAKEDDSLFSALLTTGWGRK